MTKEFGELLSQHMKRREMSQKSLAKSIGRRTGTIREIQRGEREVSIQDALKLAEVLRPSQDQREDFLLLSRGFSRSDLEGALGRGISEVRPMRKRVFKRINGAVIILRTDSFNS